MSVAFRSLAEEPVFSQRTMARFGHEDPVAFFLASLICSASRFTDLSSQMRCKRGQAEVGWAIANWRSSGEEAWKKEIRVIHPGGHVCGHQGYEAAVLNKNGHLNCLTSAVKGPRSLFSHVHTVGNDSFPQFFPLKISVVG